MPSKSLATPKRDILVRYSLGPKMKLLRTDKGLTLARLGAETGLSTALLSKLETDRMVPTLSTLAKISRVYGVDLSYFFASATHHSLAITRNTYIASERRDQPAAKQIPLHSLRADSKQLSQIVELPAGGTLHVVEGGIRREFTAYVLEGTLSMSAGGVDEVLNPGDCIVMDTDAIVTWSAINCRCRVLAVFAR